jgi:triosephosphate isomerase
MRRKLIAGNWKMNTDRATAIKLARAIVGRAGMYSAVDLLVCPPFVNLVPVSEVMKGTKVALGAQNLYHQPNGAFTGEISAAMLIDVGCTHVILGHSERRHILNETDVDVNKKTVVALAEGLVPIVCVGELLAEREAGQTGAVIRRQFEGSLAGISAEQIEKTVIAYEPVWAIGTGKVATPQQAKRCMLTFAGCLPSDTMAGLPRRSEFCTEAASRRRTPVSCCPSQTSMARSSAEPALTPMISSASQLQPPPFKNPI